MICKKYNKLGTQELSNLNVLFWAQQMPVHPPIRLSVVWGPSHILLQHKFGDRLFQWPFLFYRYALYGFI